MIHLRDNCHGTTKFKETEFLMEIEQRQLIIKQVQELEKPSIESLKETKEKGFEI